MLNEGFVEWLINDKNMSMRAAKDVLSRCKRIKKMLLTEIIDENTLTSLISNDAFLQLSTFIKSQLKRAIVLQIEFQEKNHG